MANWCEAFQKWKHWTWELSEVDGEVLILSQDMREESLVSKFRPVEPEGNSLINSVDCELHDDGVTVEVKITSNHITDTKFLAVVFEFTILRYFPGASVSK